MNKNIFKVLLSICVMVLLSACDPAEDEAKRLGFADVQEMRSIQAQGWHTKDKYIDDNFANKGFASAAAMKQSLIDSKKDSLKNADTVKPAANGSESDYKTLLAAAQKRGDEYAAKAENKAAAEAAAKAEANNTYHAPVQIAASPTTTEKYTVFFVCEDQNRAGRDDSLADLLLGEAEGDARMYAARLNSLREYCSSTFSRITNQDIIDKLGYGGINNIYFKYHPRPGVTMGVRRE
jgi:hypothetical protein